MTEPRVVYEEKARSYASLWAFVGLLGVGFLIDLFLGGALHHLLGWLLALVIVVGLNFVVVYAVRSEKSLRLTVDELRVGDEVLGRADIVAVNPAAADDLPVLGWPLGKPPALPGVTLRLTDGRQVVVPSRFPDRLRAALGVPDAAPDEQHAVRAAARADLPLLPEIDARAEALFRTAGYRLPEVPFDAAALAKAKAVFVAGRPPVGFVVVEEVAGLAYIAELAVVPGCMRQGIGTRLVERAVEWARAHEFPALALTTYADVPWNGPFYAARGFTEMTEVPRELAELRERERAAGLDEVGRRVVMSRSLS